jgi:alpha-L-fucosidase
MKRRTLLKNLAVTIPALYLANNLKAGSFLSILSFDEQIANGPFQPTWQSLKQYKTPEWYKDAKFGIWAHWGAQCQPEQGDWYARFMYDEGSKQYNFHVKKYGHPSRFGFKDVINDWKAENWNPVQLMELYKHAGAQYFVGMASHHDNFDNYNSKYQPWNSVNMGPKKDIIGGWAKAAREQGLHFGVSVHSAHAWLFYETAQRSDKKGDLMGVPYDGKLQKKDGKGTWWEGFDPQDLYAQNHPLSQGSDNVANIHKQWDWNNGATLPDKAYCDKFLNRTIDLINQYDPDLIYFDDTAVPLWPVSDAGLKIAAHLYNNSIIKKGKLEAVLNGKVLDLEQRQCMVWDIEKGRSNNLEPFVWQSDTCLGSWHYDRSIYDNHQYKTAKMVIHNLIDIVSKNGTMLLSVPVRGDGTIDSDETAIVEEIATWMKTNGECIFSTRPWKIFGEGPAQESAKPLTAQGFNEGGGKPFSSLDYRFTTKGNTLYIIALGWPENGKALIKSLSKGNSLRPESINRVELLGRGELKFELKEEGLEVILPDNKPELNYAYSLKIS